MTVQQTSKTNPNFIPPKTVKKHELNPIFRERMRRTERAFKKAYLSYNPPDYSTKRRNGQEQINRQLMEQFPDLTTTKLVRMTRVYFPAGLNLYEDSEGNVDPKVRSGLLFTLECTVADEDSMKAGVKDSIMEVYGSGAGRVSYEIGKYECVIPKLTFDRNHNIVDSRVSHFVHRYYCKDSPSEIKRIAKEFGGLPSDRLSVAIAMERGPIFENNKTYAIFNETEFVNEPIELLIGSNIRGLLSQHIGGVKAYRQWKVKEEELISGGVATEKQLRSISAEDITNLLQAKESASKLIK